MSDKINLQKEIKAHESSDDFSIGRNLSFAATEAYKRLRASLIFCLPKNENKNCRVVGITSSNMGEGKSTTSFNLAYSLAESNQRVLCLEADMRLPKTSKRLNLKTTPGLSEWLVGEVADINSVIRKIDSNLYILPSGSTPPNPSELLSSAAMRHTIDLLSQAFNFILIDLPPIGAVADALNVAELVDGMILVVRREWTTRRSLASAVRELRLTNARILGFVFNEATESTQKRKKYKGYTNRYSDNYYTQSPKKDPGQPE